MLSNTLLNTTCISEHFCTLNDKQRKAIFYQNLRKKHSFLWVYCSKCKKGYKVPKYCGDRSCPICNRRRIRELRSYLLRKWNKRPNYKRRKMRWRFLTLTFASFFNLEWCLDRINKFFKNLRRLKKFKNKIYGGIGSIEITLGDYGWHVHIHSIVEGYYFPQKELLKEWDKATCGLGKVADIRKIKSKKGIEDAIEEVSKYITEPESLSQLPDEYKKEFKKGIFKRRLIIKFGDWYDDKIYGNSKSICIYCQSELITVVDFNIRIVDEIPDEVIPPPEKERLLKDCYSAWLRKQNKKIRIKDNRFWWLGGNVEEWQKQERKVYNYLI